MKKKIAAVLVSAAALAALVPVFVLAGGSFFIDDTTGYVGVGNTTPASRLDVAGAMYSRMVTASSTAIDWNAGNVQSMTLSSSPTLTFSNGQAGGEYQLILTQDSTGDRTVTWPATVKWPGGNAPVLTSTASSTDLISLLYNGTNYLGSATLNYRTTPPESVAFAGQGSATITSSGGVGTHAYDLSSAGNHVTLIAVTCTNSKTVSGVTWNGISMSRIGTSTTHPQCPGEISVWGLTNAHAGNDSLAVTLSGGDDTIYEGLVWYSGTSDSLPDAVVDHANTTTNAVSQSLTTAHDNAWAVIVDQQNSGTASAGSNTTLRETPIATIGDSGGPIHPAGSTTLNVNFTSSSSNTYWMFSIAPHN
jgi:hypothetical protein